MYRNQEDFKKGPLLIKIEPCPKTAKAEPCSEECTKECLEKSYTIFDPKPPRKKRTSSVLVTPVVEIMESPKKSLESAGTNSEDVKMESSGNIIKSPDTFSSESVKSTNDSEHSIPSVVTPILSEVKAESTPSIEKSQESLTKSLKAESSTIEPLPVEKKSSILKKPHEEEPPDTSTLKKPQEEHPDTECVLEILILEKHSDKCEFWKPPGVYEVNLQNFIGSYLYHTPNILVCHKNREKACATQVSLLKSDEVNESFQLE